MYGVRVRGIVLLFALACAGCDPYHGFGCVAPESHPAVARARALTDAELEKVYDAWLATKDQYDTYGEAATLTGDDIPAAFKVLQADFVRMNGYVVLANCFDERVSLWFEPPAAAEPGITLSWAEPSTKDAYAEGSEVLWRYTVEQGASPSE